MRIHRSRIIPAAAMLLLALLACNLPGQNAAPPAPPAAGTVPAAPPPVLQTVGPAPASQGPAAASTATQTASPTWTSQPLSTATASGPVVTRAALCYVGPALKGYDVTSSIKAGTPVQLLGRSPVDGWWVIRDPRYHDPCFIQSIYLQIDPSMNTAGLPMYNLPATNTPGPSPTP